MFLLHFLSISDKKQDPEPELLKYSLFHVRSAKAAKQTLPGVRCIKGMMCLMEKKYLEQLRLKK